MPVPHRSEEASTAPGKLPVSGLLALATAVFITIMTEALPAGILPAMSEDLGVSEPAIGQTVTVYAIGSAIAAVPLTAATIGWSRRRLLLLAILGFAVANTVTAVSASYPLTLAARFLGGVVAGLLWALLAGYARRMVAPADRGRALAIAMAGTPVALSIGVPLGTFLANVVDWRMTFGLLTVSTLALMVWVLASVPDFPGTTSAQRVPVRRVVRISGVASVLAVTLLFVLAHNVLYTYVAPVLERVGLGSQIELVLLVFGVVSLVGIWITGGLIDRRLRQLMIASSAVFAGSALVLALAADSTMLTYAAAALWGLSFGGAATLLQTACAEAAGDAGDVAQSLVVTCWNIGIAGGGIVGALVLGGLGSSALPWCVLVLLVPALALTIRGYDHAFPPSSRRKAREASA